MLPVLLAVALAAEVRHCVSYGGDTFSLEVIEEKDPSCVVNTVSDVEALNETGWMRFNATTSSAYPDFIQMRAVGFAEGQIFQHQIFNHYHNLKDWFLFAYVPYPDYPQEVLDFLQKNLKWTRQHAHRYAEVDRFWRQVSYTLDHFDGLVEGYRAAAPAEEMLTELELWTYLSTGDLLDIVDFALPELRKDYSKMSKEEISDYLASRSHCSGLVYYHENEIYIGQTAWFFYGGMTRVFKTYTLNLNDESNIAESMTFSSYPGFSYSFDDWMVTSQGIVVIETTMNILNQNLYSNCKPESVLTWIRAQVAARGSSSVVGWHELFTQYNSGTYNNQWVIVDLKYYNNRSVLLENLIWVTEQVPGRVLADDAGLGAAQSTHYFASYNIPSFDELWIATGYPSVATGDATYDYNKSPRARIFARDVPTITNVDDMKRIMRYNRWQTDLLSIADGEQEPDPSNAISSRYDLRLDESRRKAFGGYDSKVLSYNLVSRKMYVHFISGPTTDDQNPWVFSTSGLNCPHRGLPDGPYNYEWQKVQLPVYWRSV